MNTTSLSEIAGEAYGWFEHVQRPGATDEYDRFWRVKDAAPEWVKDLNYKAHGDFLPDDWRYEAIASALAYIHDNDATEEDAGEFADSNVDVYNAARTAWLASNLNRAAYCDDAVSEFGYDSENGIFGLIGMGQYMELQEVYASVIESLEDAVANATP